MFAPPDELYPDERGVRVRRPVVLTADEVSTLPPPMLVRGWIPRAAITVLAGRPGAGKGVVVADLVARATRNDRMPNGDRLAGPFSTLIVCGPGEDGASDWKLRLVAAQADPSRYRLIEAVADDLGYLSDLRSADLDAILEHAHADGIDLVVIDSLGAVAGDVDTNKTEVRDKVLNGLASTAKRTGLAVLLIHHVRKSGGDALSIISGSTQIVAAARAALVVAEERGDDAETRFVVTAKLNGGRKSEPVAFTTTGKSIPGDDGLALRDDRDDLVYIPALKWSDRTVTRAEAEAAMMGLPTHQDDAADTLRMLLADGPMRSTDVEREMGEAGFTKDQTKRVRLRLGAATVKIGHGERAGWWTLPPGTPKAEGRAVVEQGSARAEQESAA